MKITFDKKKSSVPCFDSFQFESPQTSFLLKAGLFEALLGERKKYSWAQTDTLTLKEPLQCYTIKKQHWKPSKKGEDLAILNNLKGSGHYKAELGDQLPFPGQQHQDLRQQRQNHCIPFLVNNNIDINIKTFVSKIWTTFLIMKSPGAQWVILKFVARARRHPVSISSEWYKWSKKSKETHHLMPAGRQDVHWTPEKIQPELLIFGQIRADQHYSTFLLRWTQMSARMSFGQMLRTFGERFKSETQQSWLPPYPAPLP